MLDGSTEQAAFLNELVAEDPEAASHFAANQDDIPEPVELTPDLLTYWRGWHRLRDDRALSAMGGCGGIYYSSISQYCRDNCLSGSEFELFFRLIKEMDDEYLKHVAETIKASQSKDSQ